MGGGGAGDREYPRAQPLLRVVNERDVYRDGLTPAGIRKMLLDSLTVRFVRQLLAALGQSVLTIRVVAVGSECGALLHQMTAAVEQIAGRPHLRRIDVGHR